MIHCGECIEWLGGWSNDTFDVTITDPPFSEHTHENSVSLKGATRTEGTVAGGRKAHDPARRDLGFAPLTPKLRRDVSREMARTTKRWVLVKTDEEGIEGWRWDLRGAGLEVVRVVAWVKPDCAPQMTGDRPGAGWEPIVVAHRQNRKGKPTIKRWNGGGHRGVYVHNVHFEERVFSTETPIGLLLELVDHFTDPGELVADPFAGHGTTGAACIRRARHFVGCEVDPETAWAARERLLAERAPPGREGRTLGLLEASRTESAVRMRILPIPGWPGYFATEEGKILSTKIARKRGRESDEARELPMFDRKKKDGSPSAYLSVCLSREGGRKNCYVHHLIALAFIGERPIGAEVCHGPGGSFDNSVSNLRYDSPEVNRAERVHCSGDAWRAAHENAFGDLA